MNPVDKPAEPAAAKLEPPARPSVEPKKPPSRDHFMNVDANRRTEERDEEDKWRPF